jgi:hypothetical protein
LLIAIAAGAIAYFTYGGENPRITFIDDATNNIAILSALVGFFGTMLGFVIAVITFLFGLSETPAFAVLRASKFYNSHWAIFKGALYSCFVATCLSVACLMAAWMGIQLKLPYIAVVSASLWVIARLSRVVWVLKHMIDGEVRSGGHSRASLVDDDRAD